MRRVRAGNWLWGLLIITFGVLWMLGELDLLEFNLFFPGWWTLLIIIPCLISMVQLGINTGNVMGLGIGVVLLLARNKVVPYTILFPLIVIVIGLSLLFKKSANISAVGQWNPPVNVDKSTYRKNSAVFSSRTATPRGECYSGGTATAVFGDMKIDLRQAIIDKNIIIETTSVFGAVEIYVPDYCCVVVKGSNFLGGVSNQRTSPQPVSGPIIYIESICVFGGVTVY